MRAYEVVYVFNAATDEEALNAKLEKLHGLLTGSKGSEVVAVDHWGARQLAYPIDNQKTGYYVVAHVMAEAVDLPEFERVVKLDQDLLRYLIVMNEGQPTSGMSILAPRPTPTADADSDDDDDDDRDHDGRDMEDDDSPPEFSGGRGRRRRIDGPKIQLLNYKDVGTLSRFMTEQGKILPKRTTKVTAAFQRKLGRAVKRARFLALIPYVRDHEA